MGEVAGGREGGLGGGGGVEVEVVDGVLAEEDLGGEVGGEVGGGEGLGGAVGEVDF